MTSLLDGIRGLVTPALLSRWSAQTGESETAVSNGLMAGLPAMLLSLANRSDDSSFMSQLAGLATAAAADSDSAIAPERSSLANAPGGAADWLSKLFGSQLPSVVDSVARFAGIRGTSASALLGMAAPLVIGYLGRLMRSDSLDTAGLARRLRSERGAYSAAIPSGFDLQSLLTGPADAVRGAVDAVRHVDVPAAVAASAQGRRSGGWAIPTILAALGLGALAWWAMRDRPVPVRAGIENAAASAVGTAGSALRMLTRTLPGNVDISVPSGGMEDRLIAFLASSAGSNRSFDFDRIEFETGSATLTPTSQDQIRALATVLRAYPTARVTIGGHTDNVGNESANVALSRARAQAVSAALSAAGVASTRLTAEGYGSANPTADNSSEQGRARNRRVVLEVQRG